MALLVPVVLAVLLGILELSHMFLVSLRVSNMSRQVANVAFRDCTYLPQSSQLNCLTEVTERIRDEGILLLDDFETQGSVVASTYSRNPGESVLLLGSGGAGSHLSLFDTSRIDPDLAASYGRLAVGEVFYRYTPMTPIGSIFSFLLEEPVLYEVTIF